MFGLDVNKVSPLDEIKNIKKGNRLSFVISKLESARKLCDDYYKNYAVQIKRQHILRLIGILKDIQHWKSPEEEDKELEDILDTLEKNRQNDSNSS